THAIRGVLAILPKYQGLRAAGNSAQREILELRLHFLAKADDEIAHSLTGATGNVRLLSLWRRQFSPHRLEHSEWAELLPLVRQGGPDRREIFRAEFVLSGGVSEHRLWFAESSAVFEAPGRHEIAGVIGRLPLIKVHDALYTVLVAVGLGDHGMRREHET